MDHIEDAADSLEKHEGTYLLIAPGPNGNTFRCSRVRTREELEFFRAQFETYYDFWATWLPLDTSP